MCVALEPLPVPSFIDVSAEELRSSESYSIQVLQLSLTFANKNKSDKDFVIKPDGY